MKIKWFRIALGVFRRRVQSDFRFLLQGVLGKLPGRLAGQAAAARERALLAGSTARAQPQ